MPNDTTISAPDERAVLKPCPFCGGVRLSGARNETGSMVTVCDTCEAMGPSQVGTSLAAICDAWNTRTPPQVKALVWTLRGSLGSFAEVSFGSYHAQWDDEVRAWYGSLELGEDENPIILDPADVQTEHKAQDACQADYTRRILESLA